MVRIGMDAAPISHALLSQRLAAVKRIISPQKVTAALRRGRRFCPRIPDKFMVLFVVALGVFCADAYRQIYRSLVPWKKKDVPGRSTLCEARQRVGWRPLVRLAESVVHLLGTPEIPGCFYQGMRLMTMDAFTLDVPDTPATDRVFGRPKNGRGGGAFPQVQVLGLMEAGTYVFWKWRITDCRTDETCMAKALLKHLLADMLLLWDRGFASFDLVRQGVGRGAHLLARWKNNRILQPIRRLRDGSYLAKIYAHESDRKKDRNGIVVRIIDYTLADPGRVGRGEKHRLLTTLLDARAHPAETLVEQYHTRWEEELAIDEVKTHLMERPVLRSQTPGGVVQEIYGLLLAHYVLRVLVCEAAQKAGTSPLRISFTGTLKILRCRLPEWPTHLKAQDQWWQRLIEEIGEEQLPPRNGRINPRVIKKPQSKWPKKRAKHHPRFQPAMPSRNSGDHASLNGIGLKPVLRTHCEHLSRRVWTAIPGFRTLAGL